MASQGEIRKNKNKCGDCSNKIAKDGKGVQCELCEQWYHARCQLIDDDLYLALENDSKRDVPQIHWFCVYCNRSAVKVVSGMIKIQKQIDDLGEVVEISSSKISEIESGQFTEAMGASIESIIVNKSKEVNIELKKDILEMERRRVNAVVFKVKESNSPLAEVRKEYDFKVVEDILHNKLNLPASVKPKQIFRLGSFNKEGENVRPRPMKVVFQQEQEKQQMIDAFSQASKENRAEVADFVVAADKTKWEQAEYKRLKQELIRRKESGETDIIIRDLEIVRKRVRHPPNSN